MQIHPDQGNVILDFFPAEAHFLAEILGRIAHNYEQADPGIFYGEALGGSGYAQEDVEAWRQELREGGEDNARLARKWMALLRVENREWISWEMTPEDVGRFLLLANDHRMYLARHFGVTEQDMSVELDELEGDERRVVLLEIHFLAHMMELLLPFAPL